MNIQVDKQYESLLNNGIQILSPKISRTKYVTYDVKGKTTYLHRTIMEQELGRALLSTETIDHINKDGLDNRVENLRVCSHALNCANRKKPAIANNSSEYKGVSWHKIKQKWHVRVMRNYKAYHVGYFDKELEAAKAYDKKAFELFGEFFAPNFST